MSQPLTRRQAVKAAGAVGASLLGAEPGNDLTSKPAVELVALMRSRKVSAMEVLEAHLKQIERVNSKVNAIVTLVPEMAREAARKADEAIAKKAPLGLCTDFPSRTRTCRTLRESARRMARRCSRTTFPPAIH